MPRAALAATVALVATAAASALSGASTISTVASGLNAPEGLAVDGAGNLYFAENEADRVGRILPAAAVSTFAGTGVAGFSGDGGPATTAQLDAPEGIALDASGNLYVVDHGNRRIRKVDTSGVITTIAGTGLTGTTGDGGPATAAPLVGTQDVVVDRAGNVYVSEYHRIRRIDPRGVITTFAGQANAPGFAGDGGPAVQARLFEPSALAVDAAGNVYIADSGNSRVRKVDLRGVITTVAGTGVEGYAGDGGPAVAAQLDEPHGLAFDAGGNLYVADTENHVVRKISPDGVITTVAGTRTPGSAGDGAPARTAQLNLPRGLAVDRSGNLYVAEFRGARIRKISNAPPAARFAVRRVRRRVLFDASASRDRDGRIVAYAWMFGDGGRATARRVVRVYRRPGTYRVRLTVRDDSGVVTTSARSVVVR